MRLWALAFFQPSVDTWSKLVWPDLTTRVPSSIFGCRTSMAPLKNTGALASVAAPANSSMFHGDAPWFFSMPSRRAVPWSWPTLKLSNAT